MISIRCPACEKVVGFEEADGGSLVACPFCREPFFVPSVALPAGAEAAPAPAPPGTPTTQPPVVARLPPAPALPDDLHLVDDPEPSAEQLDELLPVEEVAAPESPPEPAPASEPDAVPRPDPIPDLELDPVRPAPEPAGAPAVVQPTDVAPSLTAAAALSEALPPAETKPERAADMLEEVTGGRDEEERSGDEEEEEAESRRKRRWKDRDEDEPRPRRGPKKGAKRRPPPADRSPWPEGLTRNRVVGTVGLAVGGTILLGTLLHHLTASQSAWHYAVCCGDLFALALCGAGLYFLIKG